MQVDQTPAGPLCRLDMLADGQSRGFDPTGRGRATMFVVRRGERVHGYRNACPHQSGARMGWKRDAFLNGDGTRIMCAAHGALFRIEDGLCVLGPCLGAALTPVALDIRDGTIWLRDPFIPDTRSRT